ncbi:MAG: DMT family transporter [Oscillospiraceae bacterium]|nr:DMT family transporter [Oscillospiraceae bacterium]
MWFLFTLLTTLLWGAADLFYKKGADETEKYSHYLTAIAVGLIMGIQAIIMLVANGFDYNPLNLIYYLPTSLMYIISMVVGYAGLRYLELSICSPVENSSGAVVTILCIIFLGQSLDLMSAVSVILVTIGVVYIGILERQEVGDVKDTDKKYINGFVALIFPLVYAVLDALGTFFDAFYLDIELTPLVDVTEENIEDVANISYMLTFLIVALILLFYVLVIKKEKIALPKQGDKVAAAIFETAGQYFYVYAMSGNAIVAAPLISAYSIVSIVLSRIFLKEKLTPKQYIAIAIVMAGILVMGVAEGLAE